MRTRLVGLGMVAAIVALLAGTQAAADSSFADATGDHGMTPELTAPDISGVQISNTRDGTITLRVEIENYEALPPRSRIVALFDLDRDLTTSELGFERAVSHRVDETGQARVVLERWNEPTIQYVEIPGTAITSTFSAGTYTLTMPRAALANTVGFNFGLYAALFGTSQRDRVVDSAPDENRWSYTLTGLPAPTLSAQRLMAMPARPVAGRTFTVGALVRRSDTGGALGAGTVTCTARIGNARVRAVGAFSGGRARCVLSVPRNVAGKTLRGTLTVRAAGGRLTRAFSYRIR